METPGASGGPPQLHCSWWLSILLSYRPTCLVMSELFVCLDSKVLWRDLQPDRLSCAEDFAFSSCLRHWNWRIAPVCLLGRASCGIYSIWLCGIYSLSLIGGCVAPTVSGRVASTVSGCVASTISGCVASTVSGWGLCGISSLWKNPVTLTLAWVPWHLK